MPLEKLTYTPKSESANDRPITMVVVVDTDMYAKYTAGGSGDDKDKPALTAVVDSFEIFKFDKPGSKQGPLGQPSKTELQNAFGTTNETEIIEFMLKHGQLLGSSSGKKGGGAASQPPDKNHMEELLHADRRAY